MTTKCFACRYSHPLLCVKCAEKLKRSQEQFSAHLQRQIDEDQQLLDDIDSHDRPVNEWESKFIASCMAQERRILTANQRDKAWEILARLEGET